MLIIETNYTCWQIHIMGIATLLCNMIMAMRYYTYCQIHIIGIPSLLGKMLMPIRCYTYKSSKTM